MGKHAYLIIAHNKWDQLRFLIDVLNDPRNDFFLMIDSKSKDFDQDRFAKSLNTKNVFFPERVDTRWGNFSQISAEFNLLKAACVHSEYDYYHLLSGIDMPLKSQKEIHDFFDSMMGTEFVDFDRNDDHAQALERAQFHYYFQTIIGRHRHTPLKALRDGFVFLEKILGVNRVKDIENDLGKGSNWFSITDDFARYVVSNEEFIKDHFINTYCCDEVFLQTLLNRSPYKKNWYGYKNPDMYYQNLRYLDWGRGKPYTFKKDEFFDICDSGYIFARKFSSDIISEDIKIYLTQGIRQA